ncbi:hypothetical protein M3O96_17780, partial [Aquiflexum sp. TKW24L]|uniref:hypothetical protein n=1 Tax=Aquiflexum sp. TKW24L TaxID=2942212 RepID=UPI0020BE020A
MPKQTGEKLSLHNGTKMLQKNNKRKGEIYGTIILNRELTSSGSKSALKGRNNIMINFLWSDFQNRFSLIKISPCQGCG